MAIAHDISTQAAAYSLTGTQTTSHAANASASAAVVLIEQNGSVTDQVSGVTYGGVAMTRLRFDTEATESGGVYIYWLDGITGGTQNVAMTTTGTTTKYLSVSTMTVAAGSAVLVAGTGNTATSASAANPALTISGLTAGVPYVAYEIIHSGLQTMTTTPQTTPAWTLIAGVDVGSQGYGFARIANTPASTTLAAGWIAATADDYVISGVAFREIVAPLAITASGASVSDGVATVKQSSVVTASGTSTSDATATISMIVKAVIDNGLHWYEVADRFTPWTDLASHFATWGALTAGSVTDPSSGSVAASILVTVTHAGSSAGTSTSDGTAAVKQLSVVTTSGISTSIGTAAVIQRSVVTSTGASLSDGSAAIRQRWSGTTSGVSVSDGTASARQTLRASSSGSSLSDGSAPAGIRQSLSSSGASASSGSLAASIYSGVITWTATASASSASAGSTATVATFVVSVQAASTSYGSSAISLLMLLSSDAASTSFGFASISIPPQPFRGWGIPI